MEKYSTHYSSALGGPPHLHRLTEVLKRSHDVEVLGEILEADARAEMSYLFHDFKHAYPLQGGNGSFHALCIQRDLVHSELSFLSGSWAPCL